MTDDLVKRLTILVSDTDTELLAIEAADRIEAQQKLIRKLLRDLWDSSWPTMRKYDTFEEYRDAVLGEIKDAPAIK